MKRKLELSHKKLDVWKLSLSFVDEIYETTSQFPRSEIFGLTSQIRRASVSIASNIAEGASRTSKKERKRFYEIARSSLVEIDTQLIIACRLRFIGKDKLSNLEEMTVSIFSMLSKLISNT